MGLPPISNQAYSVLWYFIPLAILAGVFKSGWFKGVMGEFIVNLSAKLFLSKEKYHLIKNVTLPTDDGTTQIDHIIVSAFGVFVVETKNMKGWIFGQEHQKQWTQKIFKHSQKFQNPLHQNYKHIKTLEQLLDLQSSQLHSVVVFVGDSTFKAAMPKNVTHGMGYVRYIKSITEPVLTTNQVNDIINKIESGRYARTLSTHVEHVRHVRSIVNEKEKVVFCPKCGSEMVLREAKKGDRKGQQFWGCRNYPRCKQTLELSRQHK
jgi:predicted RNA-binding Zn-ribbon protein involved in translation (DUF1610 family)